ncbi:MAG: STAS domain-containing protein [Actinomycetota bacterium]
MNATDGPTFSVQIHAHGDDAVVVAAGEVDLDSAPRLREALASALVLARAEIVVDLAGVHYLDSSGVHCILDGARDAELRGIALQVVRVRRPVFAVLEITGVTRGLPVEIGVGA